MVKRLEEAQPDFFEANNQDKEEFIAHLTHNMCLPYTKAYSQVYRKRTAELKEEAHLKDTIRRLYNGGDKFHPYL